VGLSTGLDDVERKKSGPYRDSKYDPNYHAMKIKIAIPQISLNAQNLSSITLPTQGVMHPKDVLDKVYCPQREKTYKKMD
jgi:hypothetical protein